MVVVDDGGRLLLVRKGGTTAFMQPGGKPERGESALTTGVREVAEELGLSLSASRFTPLGTFDEDAANEAGYRVVADSFRAVLTPDEVTAVVPGAEIAEAVWVTPEEARALQLAPLTRTHFLRLASPHLS